MIMAFDIFKKKKSEETEEEVEEVKLPPELEQFKLQGPPFPKRAAPEAAPVEAPQRRPFVPEEYAEERFGPRPQQHKAEPEEDRISIILHKLDIIESRLKIIEEKLKR
jgi:hypothetical protein